MQNRFVPYGRQWIDEEDVEAVISVLRSDWITQGPKIEEFEKRIAQYCGAKYAIATSSGTAALHLACLAAGIGDGDGVITSANTFVASANCALYVGAKPVLVDINPRTYNLDVQKLRGYLKANQKQLTPRIKAVIPVHFAGQPCDMEEICEIARGYDLTVIEDAAHAIGAKYKAGSSSWIRVGSCIHSEMTVFSFHPVKHITTGEGGMVLTNEPGLYERLSILRNHGITKNPSLLTQKGMPWYYEMQSLGFNYRITDFQCALGISQWRRLDKFVARRREIAKTYNEAFKGMKDITTPFEKKGVRSAYHLYPLLIDFKQVGKSRAQVMDELRCKGVGTQVHYIPVHLHPYYQEKLGYKLGDFPIAENYYQKALSLPIYPKMSEQDVDLVIGTLAAVLGE